LDEIDLFEPISSKIDQETTYEIDLFEHGTEMAYYVLMCR